MTDLECRALLGDKQAQEECTRNGIVLPCPCCGGKAKKTLLLGRYGIACTNCLVCIIPEPCVDEYDKILADWNTRPAPPIGRCKDCANWRGEQGDTDAPCRDCDGVMEADNFCKNFEPKMPYLPNEATLPAPHALQREIRDRRKLGQPTSAVVETLREMEKEVKRNEKSVNYAGGGSRFKAYALTEIRRIVQIL